MHKNLFVCPPWYTIHNLEEYPYGIETENLEIKYCRPSGQCRFHVCTENLFKQNPVVSIMLQKGLQGHKRKSRNEESFKQSHRHNKYKNNNNHNGFFFKKRVRKIYWGSLKAVQKASILFSDDHHDWAKESIDGRESMWNLIPSEKQCGKKNTVDKGRGACWPAKLFCWISEEDGKTDVRVNINIGISLAWENNGGRENRPLWMSKKDTAYHYAFSILFKVRVGAHSSA